MENLKVDKIYDLEITSIGALYSGHWGKKYWSSSRGKDRHPYPVGYKATRTNSGNTYMMEIHEGLKGPLFTVSTPDGDSCTGQTPNIAWENFQKKSGPRVKNWPGKRFSTKIDGVELFGFRNPFVQRLLRELVMNENGVAESSLAAPSFSNRVSELEQERNVESYTHPDLLPPLDKQHITRKRSMKNRSADEVVSKEARIKRKRNLVLLNNAASNDPEFTNAVCSFVKDTSTESFQEPHMSSSKDGETVQVTSSPRTYSLGGGITVVSAQELALQGDCELVGCASSIKSCDGTVDTSSPPQVNMPNVVGENYHSLLPVGEVLKESKHSEKSVNENMTSNGQSSRILTHVDKIELEMNSFDAELEQSDPLTLAKNNDGQHVDLVYKDITVPDTCDTDKDSIVSCPLEEYKASPYSTKDELAVVLPALNSSACCPSRYLVRSLPDELAIKSNHDVSKYVHLQSGVQVTCMPVNHFPSGVIKDSLLEAGSSSSSSNSSSEKVDLDVAGQELARSMMTFLLPRAVPLLPKTYVKRRSKRRCPASKHKPCSTLVVPTHDEQVQRELLTDRMCLGYTVDKVTVQGPELHIKEKMNAPQILQGVDSLCELNRTEPLLAGCTVSEPFTQNGSSNSIKSLIPDSFEDYQCAHDVASKRHPPSFGEGNNARFDGVEGYLSSLVLPENKSEMRCSSNDGYNGEVLLPDGNKKDNRGAEILRHEIMPRRGLSTSDKAERSFQRPCPLNNGADEDAKASIVQSHMNFSAEKSDGYSRNGQINLNVHSGNDSKDANVKIQVGARDIAYVSGNHADSMVKNGTSFLCKSNVLSSGELLPDSHNVGKIPQPCVSSEKHAVPLSEVIICRKYEDCDSSERHFHQNLPSQNANDRTINIDSDADIRTSVTNEVTNLKTDKDMHQLIAVKNVPASVHALVTSAPDASRNYNMVESVKEDVKSSNFIDPTFSSFIECVNPLSDVGPHGESCKQSEEQANALESLPFSDTDPPIQSTIDHDRIGFSHTQVPKNSHLDDSSSLRLKSTLGMRYSMELHAQYLHPSPVLSISLASKEDGLKICVLCGLVDSNIRSVFMYTLPVQECNGNCPSFLGYTLLMVPFPKDPCCRNKIPLEKSGLQLIPDKQCLVFSSSIKAPHCREQRIDCLCTNCKVAYREENIVEIVHVNFGYVSTRIKLVTTERASSILACETNYLIASEQSGRLHVWVMNFEWSENLEEFMLPKFDEISPMILEMKQIPNCSSLIIGHNGLGGFAIWNISQRVLLAKFSSPGITTFQILPIGLFKCQSEDSLATCMVMEHIEEIISMVDNLCHKAGGAPCLSSLEKDIAIWLLVSADSDTDAQFQVDESNEIPAGGWRLGMLVRNTVILGSILDPRASVASTSSYYGIHGTRDGFLHKWKLSSGENLASLHPFKCGSVSNIAVDARSGAVAVAGDRGQLLVYVQPRDCKSEVL